MIALALMTALGADPAAALNDYPTEARADYVFTCMAANGQTRQALSECSCAIDHIASVLPYKRYVAAETVLAMRQTSGERAEVFRSAEFNNAFARDLQSAAAEAEVLCFTPVLRAPD
ncbi:hypothetical protein DRW48_12635 [Paracoccus suum]|uniref:Uncharacterized protein n=1 Tax=Paracoccus suum TaxID=2259340 RepID=A0A344PM11_9RHOB|nr:hypothetical protein [Paracoccus suum]AXC50416.1 hypothetical protein DRW48_12635 [Paracoccus suum]